MLLVSIASQDYEKVAFLQLSGFCAGGDFRFPCIPFHSHHKQLNFLNCPYTQSFTPFWTLELISSYNYFELNEDYILQGFCSITEQVEHTFLEPPQIH